jgi:ATP-dependent RNA helicase RhlE
VPTRELAEQIHDAVKDFGKHTKLRSATVYGGVGKGAQIQALKRGVEIVVACPGRLLDLAGEREIDLSQVEVLVLDEADRMCDMGFLPDIRRILKLVPNRKQTLFFSATMPDDIRDLSDSMLNDPVTVQIGMVAPAKTVSHAIYPVTQKMKKSFLFAILDKTKTGRVLVFTRTKHRAKNLARDLEKQGHNAAALQGNMTQNKRQKAINGFRSGQHDILVATDVASRGIDVADISHVINFDMPDTVDAYTHRIGRTGRAEESGEAYTLATADDVIMVRDIERLLGKPLERRQLESFDYGGFTPELVTPVGRQQSPRNNNNRPSKNNNRRRNNRRPNNQAQAGRNQNQPSHRPVAAKNK